jgi:hypothetical protein
LYHSRDRIVAASRLLQIYTESANPIGAVLSCFFLFLYVLFFINIASIFITLTEINNEKHNLPKKKQNKTYKNKKKQDKTAPIGFALSV